MFFTFPSYSLLSPFFAFSPDGEKAKKPTVAGKVARSADRGQIKILPYLGFPLGGGSLRSKVVRGSYLYDKEILNKQPIKILPLCAFPLGRLRLFRNGLLQNDENVIHFL